MVPLSEGELVNGKGERRGKVEGVEEVNDDLDFFVGEGSGLHILDAEGGGE